MIKASYLGFMKVQFATFFGSVNLIFWEVLDLTSNLNFGVSNKIIVKTRPNNSICLLKLTQQTLILHTYWSGLQTVEWLYWICKSFRMLASLTRRAYSILLNSGQSYSAVKYWLVPKPLHSAASMEDAFIPPSKRVTKAR